MARRPTGIVGWRERVDIPKLGLTAVRAKVDTGARTSSLHAEDVQELSVKGKPYVRFRVADGQDATRVVRARLKEHRWVTSSNGAREHRPVITTTLVLGSTEWRAELTLTSRGSMGFPMLLGREALRGRFLIDPDRSFVQSEKSGPR